MDLKYLGRKSETPDVFTFRFESPELKDWQPGQYLHYTLPHANPDDRGIERYFTISSPPSDGVITITTRIAEKSSTFKLALVALKPGGIIQADGLEGNFILADPRTECVFVAGGIGITPFRAILRDLDTRNSMFNITLLYANRDDKFPFRGEMESIASRRRGLSIRWIVAPKMLDEAAIRETVSDLSRPVVYLSGPKPMVDSFSGRLEGMGVPKARIMLDDFPGYTWP